MKNSRKSTVRTAVVVQNGMQALSLGYQQKQAFFRSAPEPAESPITSAEEPMRTPEEELFRAFLTRHLPRQQAPADLAKRIRSISSSRD